MLVLNRKVGESFIIGDDIEIFIVDNAKGGVRVGIEAPKKYTIIRKELKEAVIKSNKSATINGDVDFSGLNFKINTRKLPRK